MFSQTHRSIPPNLFIYQRNSVKIKWVHCNKSMNLKMKISLDKINLAVESKKTSVAAHKNLEHLINLTKLVRLQGLLRNKINSKLSRNNLILLRHLNIFFQMRALGLLRQISKCVNIMNEIQCLSFQEYKKKRKNQKLIHPRSTLWNQFFSKNSLLGRNSINSRFKHNKLQKSS